MVLHVAMPRSHRAVEERCLGAVQLLRRVTANGDQPSRPVPLIVEVLVGLEAAEVVENVTESPAGIAQGGPGVIIRRRAS